ncbi:MAG: NAD(P)/FAD-dependent oxidoreductase [Clostridia bacterium]|nr:NAD(P)/FAD-dependent oxidoreductase [Clostridia bacterium]
MYDIAIIGAGVTGAMTAYYLAKYDLHVAVLEKNSDVASGTTKANSAIVHAGFDAKPGTKKAALNVKGCAMMETLTETLGVHYKKCGSYVLGFSDGDKDRLEELKARGEQNGVPELSILSGEELRKKEPNLSPEVKWALSAPTAGIVCPYDLTLALAENAASNGVDFYFDFPVCAVRRAGETYVLEGNGREVEARYIVNAAGLASADMATLLGEENFPVTILPRRGEYMLLDRAEGAFVSATMFVLPDERGKGILISPTVDGNLIVGPNAQLVEDREDRATTDAGLAEITAGARRIAPGVNLRAVITSFAGVRSTPSTGDFYLEISEQCPHVIHAVGIESPGLASSPAVGEYIVSLLAKDGVVLREKETYVKERRPGGNRPLFRDLSEAEKQARIKEDPAYGKIVCRCETITEGDILDAIRRPVGARNLDMVKRRVRAGMGRCQGGFCSPRVAELLASELKVPLSTITKTGGGSYLLTEKTK